MAAILVSDWDVGAAQGREFWRRVERWPFKPVRLLPSQHASDTELPFQHYFFCFFAVYCIAACDRAEIWFLVVFTAVPHATAKGFWFKEC